MNNTLFITGAAGFIGHETVKEAVKAGWQVKGLVHSEKNAQALHEIGAQPVVGDAHLLQHWIGEALGVTAFIDLIQPKFPKRLSRKAIEALSSERQVLTRALLDALKSLSVHQRPLFISVSGADDLQPDAQHLICHDSPLRSQPRGFAYIGIPVRRLIEVSGLDAAYIYFGNLVYGPGKIFAEQFVSGLQHGTAPIVGKGENRLPLTYVTDAARALVHLAARAETDVVGRTFLAADGSDATQRVLLEATADAMGVTRSPMDAWTAQQLREATAFGVGPKYLIRDNDTKFGMGFARVAQTSRDTQNSVSRPACQCDL